MGDFERHDPPDPAPRDEPVSGQPEQVTFPFAVRGYDRLAVDEYVQSLLTRLNELEAGQTPGGAVQRALDQVGVETAGILQRAHAAADELAARSRAEANQRIQRAQNEADQIKRDADHYSEQIVADTRVLWEERMGLIEDLRQLADRVLSTADDAFERLQMPEPLAGGYEDPEPTTSEEPALPPNGDPASDLNGPGSLDDTEAWSVGEFEAERPEGETGEYESFGDETPSEPQTAHYRIGAVENEFEEETDRTVELEALPGGAGQEPAASGERQPEGWDRERD